MLRCASSGEKEKSILQTKRNRGIGFKKEVEELIEYKEEMFSKNGKVPNRHALDRRRIDSVGIEQDRVECSRKLAHEYEKLNNLLTSIAGIYNQANQYFPTFITPNITFYGANDRQGNNELLYRQQLGSFAYSYNQGRAVCNAVSGVVRNGAIETVPIGLLGYPNAVRFNSLEEFNKLAG